MRIAMRGIDRHAALAGIGRELDMPRTEGERLAAAAGQHDGAGMEPFHLDARHRPGICPRPGFYAVTAGDALVKSPLQQHLGQQGLGVDVGALAEQHEAGECENESNMAKHRLPREKRRARASGGERPRAP